MKVPLQKFFSALRLRPLVGSALLVLFLFVSASLQAQDKVKESWKRNFNYLAGHGDEYDPVITTDSNGNVYIAGVTNAGGVCGDIITIKYSRDKVLQWMKRYPSPAGSCGKPSKVVLDTFGNVLVAVLLTYPEARGRQAVTLLKYSGSDGSKHSSSVPYEFSYSENNKISLVAASREESYIAGSDGDGKMFIAKFSKNAAQKWVTTYQAPDNGYCSFAGLALDSFDEPHIGGTVKRQGIERFIILKYAGGDKPSVRLVREYAYSQQGTDFRNIASDIAVASGNIIVTGTAYNTANLEQSKMVTLQYSGAGSLLHTWVFEGEQPGRHVARALQVDNNNDIYMLGTTLGTAGDTDLLTIKYTSAGGTAWKRVFVSSQKSEQAEDVVLNPSQDVYITGSYSDGSGFVAVKYSATGVEEWNVPYNVPADGYTRLQKIMLDNPGNVFLAGSIFTNANFDLLLVKLEGHSANTTGWQVEVNVEGLMTDAAESLKATVMDKSGNLFMTGQSDGSFATVRYDSAGTFRWLARAVEKEAQPRAIALSPDGHVLVSGYKRSTLGDDNTRNLNLIKYDGQSGQRIWVREFSEIMQSEVGEALVVDKTGHVYVAAYALPSGQVEGDILLLKYDAAGMLLWKTRYAGSDNLDDKPVALALDKTGNLILTGFSGSSAGNLDFITLKYNPAGELLWQQRFNHEANGPDVPAALALDKAGNIYVTGSSATAANGLDYMTLKYSPAGALLWQQQYNGEANQDDQAVALKVDGAGNLYLTGSSTSSTSGLDLVTFKYSPKGKELWRVRYNGKANLDDKALALAFDGFGNVYLTGSSATNATAREQVSLKYDPDGLLIWNTGFDATGGEETGFIGLGPGNQVYVGGSALAKSSQTSKLSRDFMLVRYNQPVYTTIWTAGAGTTDWYTAKNWTNGVPNYQMNAIIPNGLSIYPDLLAAPEKAKVRNLYIDQGRLNITDGWLDIKGAYINTLGFMEGKKYPDGKLKKRLDGTVGELETTTTGVITFTGAGQQSVGLNGTSAFMNLTVGPSGLILDGPVLVRGVLQLDGNLDTRGHELILASDATGTAMVVNNGGEVLGKVTVQRYITPDNIGDGYRHYSSPVTSTTVSDLATPDFTPLVNPYWNVLPTPALDVSEFPTVQKYDETRLSADYNYFKIGWISLQTLDDPLLPGHGYTVNLPGTAQVDFVGTLNNGTITVPVTRGPVSGSGWNFLGNPYPAPIDWDNIVRPEGVNNAVYVFQSSGKYKGSYLYYANGVGSLTDGIIPAMQGFMVRATQNTTFTFTNAARLTTYQNPAFRRTVTEDRPLVNLEIRAEDGKADQAFVYFQAGADLEAGSSFDAYKLPGFEAGHPSIASVAGGESLAINGLPMLTQDVFTVPLEVKTTQPGTHTLHARQVINFSSDTEVYLSDKLTGQLQNLHLEPEYHFTATENDQDRFVLIFKQPYKMSRLAGKESAGEQAREVVVYPNPLKGKNRQLQVRMSQVQAETITARLSSVLGREVLQVLLPVKDGSVNASLDLSQLARGIYILQLPADNTVTATRVVIE